MNPALVKMAKDAALTLAPLVADKVRSVAVRQLDMIRVQCVCPHCGIRLTARVPSSEGVCSICCDYCGRIFELNVNNYGR